MNTYIINLAEQKTEFDFMPTMQAYILDETQTGPRPMVVVCPGGAYSGVSWNWEGERIAMAYVAAGFHAAVVNYCVAPHCHPLPIQNVAKAIQICRENAENWLVDTDKIAVCGFSAGGHLAASISTLWDSAELFSKQEITDQKHMPNATILCYPVITSGEKAHKSSFRHLIGSEDESLPEWSLLSLENQVDDKTPPAFLWHTFEDAGVPMENSMLYASALRKHNVPFELHVYPKGRHGLSMCTKDLPRTKSVFNRDYGWVKMSIDWLSDVFEL